MVQTFADKINPPMPNVFGAYLQGQQFKQAQEDRDLKRQQIQAALSQQQAEAQKATTLADLGRQYVSAQPGQRQELGAQIAGLDPQTATKLQEFVANADEQTRANTERTNGEILRSLETIKTAAPQGPQAMAAALQQEGARLLDMGINPGSFMEGLTLENLPQRVEQAYIQAQTIGDMLKARGEAQQPQEPIGKLNAALEAGHITPEQHAARLAKLNSTSGTNVTVNMPGKQAPTKKTINDAQADLAFAEENLVQLDRIEELFDPEFLTFMGRGQAAWASFEDKAFNSLSPEQRTFIQRRTKFKTAVERQFNAYRKAITGAAASVQELDRLKESMFNTDQGPAQFQAAFHEYRSEVKRGIRLKRRLLREGISINDEDFGEQFDRAFLSDQDDTDVARYDELISSGLSDEEALDTLLEEGYLRDE